VAPRKSDFGVLWPNGWMDQDETWLAGRHRPWPHCLRWGPSSRSPKGAQPPIFGPYLLWPNGWMDQDNTWHGGEPWSGPHCARWGPSSPPQKGAEPPLKFSDHFYCGQTFRCIKMPLGMEVDRSPCDFVLDGDSAAPLSKKGAELPIFGPCLLWPNGWMHQDATWYGGRPHPRRLCVRWGSSPSPKRGLSPQFSANVYCGQTAGWIKMPLNTEVGLGPDDNVLDGDPASPPRKNTTPRIFGPCLLWPNVCMYQDTAW